MSRIGTAFERAVSSAVSPRTPEPYVPSVTLKLNVGGAKFTTTYSTVRNIDGMLSAMFSGRYSLSPGADGYHFIDRDGTHFRHILNLLRFPSEFEVDLPKGELMELEREVRYYGLGEAYALARTIHTPIIAATSVAFGIHEDPDLSASFRVGDRELPATHRGWNVLLFDPKTNTVISQTPFDTWRDKSAVQRLATFLNAVPQGYIVAIAVFSDGGANVSTNMELEKALHNCGAVIRNVELRANFAMVGVKGWASTAVEACDTGKAVVIATRPAGTCQKW
mmetsp:Transcript_35763/g.77178  ORF Transcript_35763/g.77178 Transcript_35763/m.77178 type:complete len:279 (-) Transcript_35763:8-844(-)